MGQVLGNGGIAGIRQAQLLQADRPLPERLGIGRAVGEEAFHEHAFDLGARQLALDRTADHFAASAQHGHGPVDADSTQPVGSGVHGVRRGQPTGDAGQPLLGSMWMATSSRPGQDRMVSNHGAPNTAG